MKLKDNPMIISWTLLLISLTMIMMESYSKWSNSSTTMEMLVSPMNSSEGSIIILMDQTTLAYSMCVSIVSSSILMFSLFYMKGTLKYRSFMYTMILFILSMLMLVSSGNLLTLFVGWEGLGISSFCLVIFYESYKSMSSGLITILSNRLGDILMIMSISMMMINGGNSTNFMTYCNQTTNSTIILSAMTKSAQIPFSAWLPAAMAAPTPVSALVHSSTLVTAGMFVMTRFNFMFFKEKWMVMAVSMATMLAAGLFALSETDMKKLVAMSTLSQLGMMSVLIAHNLWKYSLMHMMYHSIFKSLMFMTAGSIILNSTGNQDLRKTSKNTMVKISSVMMLSSCMSLAGFPFTLGFYSKDMMIIMSSTFWLPTTVLFNMGCLMTILYAWRLSALPMLNKTNNPSSTKQSNSTLFTFASSVSFVMCSMMGKKLASTLSSPVLLTKTSESFMGVVLLITSTKMMKTIKKKSTMEMMYLKWISTNAMSKLNYMLKTQNIEKSWMEMMSMTYKTGKKMKQTIKNKMKKTTMISPMIMPIILMINH